MLNTKLSYKLHITLFYFIIKLFSKIVYYYVSLRTHLSKIHKYIYIYINDSVNVCLRAHIKFFIFKNIFSQIKKAVITFSIFKNFFSKMKINMCPKGTHY